jgi:hypothetical protein
MIEALRIYMYDYGTIPTWNFFFCGGRPELSIPFSWAYTWTSLFAYAFEPNHAMIAVWLCMRAVGFFAMRSLLLHWTCSELGSGVGAAIYVSSGIFGTAFNLGHVPWAFYHFIPLLMLLFERHIDPRRTPRQHFLVIITLVSVLFFTSGLPHALIYFYPAFVALVLFRFFSTAIHQSFRAALAIVGPPLTAHGLGLGLGLGMSMYKLWPAIRWQFESPRRIFTIETATIADVLRQTLVRQIEWGFDTGAFIGPMVWLVAIYGVFRALRGWKTKDGAMIESRSLIAWFVIPVLFAGILLALGSDRPLLPGFWFQKLPVLNGIRGFPRFMILALFSLCILAAYGLSWIGRDLALGRFRNVIAVALALACLAPIWAHAAHKIRDVPASSIPEIQRSYRLPQSPDPPEMLVVTPRGAPWFAKWPHGTHAVATLQKGYWLANCRLDISLPHVFVSRKSEGKGWPLGAN